MDHEAFDAGKDEKLTKSDREEERHNRSVHEGTEDDVHQERVLVVHEEEGTQVDPLKVR